MTQKLVLRPYCLCPYLVKFGCRLANNTLIASYFLSVFWRAPWFTWVWFIHIASPIVQVSSLIHHSAYSHWVSQVSSSQTSHEEILFNAQPLGPNWAMWKWLTNKWHTLILWYHLFPYTCLLQRFKLLHVWGCEPFPQTLLCESESEPQHGSRQVVESLWHVVLHAVPRSISFARRQLFAWPRSSLCLREAELGETDFAQFHSESDKSRLSRRRRSKEGYLAICLILFFSVFLWMSWGGLDRDFFFGGLIPLHVQCLATFSTKDPKLIPIGESKDKGQRSKLTMNFYKWQNATEVRENSMDILMQQSAWKRGTCSKMKRAKGKETLGIKLKSSGTRKKHKV